MACIDPKLCYTNEKGKRLFRHFTLANPEFIKLHQQRFDCGTCLHCRKKKSYELACRCVLHASLYKDNCFLTLTYDEKKEGYHNELNYSDIQKFKKRLRVYVHRTKNQRIEIFNVHEYGKKGKKHWHLVVFNFDFDDKETIPGGNAETPFKTSKTLQKLWPYGHVSVGTVTTASAMYQSQYIEKDFKNGNRTNKKKSKSNHSGIAKAYFLKHYKQILELGYVPINGKKLPIPRYFQKLAHKHWCHYYAPAAFKDTHQRKKLYNAFKNNEANKDIADTYILFKNIKEEKLLELRKEWDDVISHYLTTLETPDFILSGQNTLHDLHNKQTREKF